MRLAPEHAAAYRALMLHAYTESADAFTSTVEERSSLPLSWWQSRLDDSVESGNIVFGEFFGEALAGVTGLARNQGKKTSHKAKLFGMYVHPDFRRSRIASSLLESALAFARSDNNILEIQLTVSAGNALALGLYERAGFTRYGAEPRAICTANGFIDKVLMRFQADSDSRPER